MELRDLRQKIADYMNDAISMGVAGFRIDAAKHIPAEGQTKEWMRSGENGRKEERSGQVKEWKNFWKGEEKVRQVERERRGSRITEVLSKTTRNDAKGRGE